MNNEETREIYEYLPKRTEQPYRERIKSLIIALRSGDYKQGKGQNRYEGRYCCLGVGCDIFHKKTGKGEWVESAGIDYFEIGIKETGYILPKEVKKWYGFSHENPCVIIPPKYRDEILEQLDHSSEKLNLGTLNDEFLDFEQIADVLEYNFLSEE